MIFMDYIFYVSVNWWFDTCEPVIVVFIFHEVSCWWVLFSHLSFLYCCHLIVN